MQHFLEWEAQLYDHVEACGLEWHPLDFPVEAFLDEKLFGLLMDHLRGYCLNLVEDLDFEMFANELYQIFSQFADDDDDQADDVLEITERTSEEIFVKSKVEEFGIWMKIKKKSLRSPMML